MTISACSPRRSRFGCSTAKAARSANAWTSRRTSPSIWPSGVRSTGAFRPGLTSDIQREVCRPARPGPSRPAPGGQEVRRPAALVLNLRGSQSLVAGPFSGTLVSTVVMRPSSSGESQTSGSSGSSLGPPPRRKLLVEQVTLCYRVSCLPGALETSFSGEPDPFCAAIDSCAARGTLGLSLLQPQNQLILIASRTVQTRVGARRAIADLRRGRLRFGAITGVGVGTVVTETFSGGDGLRCQDSATGGRALVQFIPLGARRSTSRP